MQRAILNAVGDADTLTCQLSGQACAGALPGDLTPQFVAAQQETYAVAIREFAAEVAAVGVESPDASFVRGWIPILEDAGAWTTPTQLSDAGAR